MALILPKASDIDGGKIHRVPETEHSGTILAPGRSLDEISSSRLRGRARAGTRRRRVNKTMTQLTLDVMSESAWAFNVRADLFIEHVMDSLLAHHHENIKLGQKADGSGPQPPLSTTTIYTSKSGNTVRKSQANRRSMHRGYNTGLFADMLYRSRISGSTATANATIKAHRDRARWLAIEANRGNEFLFVTGEAEVVITAALEQVLIASLNGSVKPQPDSGEQIAASA